MTHWSNTAGRLALILVAGFSVAAATPLAAQQEVQQEVQQAASVTVDAPSAPQVGAPAAPLPGPRLSPEWPRVQPSATERNATARPAPPAQNTIVISTLALVLIAIIATILILD